MREDIDFKSSGLTLRGWLYRPEGKGPHPGIVMSHGFSAVKEQGLAAFAEAFRAAGFVVLVFDCRHLGASDGDDRGRIVAQEQHDDLRAALATLSSQPGVDQNRIGVWGTSYSGGHALYVGHLDPRVKAIVAQAPAISVTRSLVALAGQEGFAGYLQLFAGDHESRNAGGAPGYFPVVAPAGEPSVLATPDSYDWFVEHGSEAGSTWLNRTSIESVARMAEYDSSAFLGVLAAKPLLLIAGQSDSLIPIAQVREAFARAGQPKKLEEFACGHFDFYPGGPFHAEASRLAVDWFRTHLDE